MNNQMLKLAGLGIGVVLVAAFLSVPVLAAEEGHGGHKMKMSGAKAPTGCHSMHEMHMKKLDDALKAIDKAVKALEAGNKHTAIAELGKARQLVATCKKAMSEMGKKDVVNTICPVMGTKLNPGKVPAKLTRLYKGKTVGLCCAGCPAAWDKLSEKEKAKKASQFVPPVTPKAKV